VPVGASAHTSASPGSLKRRAILGQLADRPPAADAFRQPPPGQHRRVHHLGRADSSGLLTLLSDGLWLTGAYDLGPEAGEWLAGHAIQGHLPLVTLREVIQPFSAFSGVYVASLKARHNAIMPERRPPVLVLGDLRRRRAFVPGV
jgi:hypothetical protein